MAILMRRTLGRIWRPLRSSSCAASRSSSSLSPTVSNSAQQCPRSGSGIDGTRFITARRSQVGAWLPASIFFGRGRTKHASKSPAMSPDALRLATFYFRFEGRRLMRKPAAATHFDVAAVRKVSSEDPGVPLTARVKPLILLARPA
jgi:hypothetical protein